MGMLEGKKVRKVIQGLHTLRRVDGLKRSRGCGKDISPRLALKVTTLTASIPSAADMMPMCCQTRRMPTAHPRRRVHRWHPHPLRLPPPQHHPPTNPSATPVSSPPPSSPSQKPESNKHPPALINSSARDVPKQKGHNQRPISPPLPPPPPRRTRRVARHCTASTAVYIHVYTYTMQHTSFKTKPDEAYSGGFGDRMKRAHGGRGGGCVQVWKGVWGWSDMVGWKSIFGRKRGRRGRDGEREKIESVGLQRC